MKKKRQKDKMKERMNERQKERKTEREVGRKGYTLTVREGVISADSVPSPFFFQTQESLPSPPAAEVTNDDFPLC